MEPHSPTPDPQLAQGVIATLGASLSPEFLAAVDWLESHPENAPGSDKTWVFNILRRNREHFARAVRVR